MTLNEKEGYEIRIKNMQSKIDYLREQRENLTTYAKKYVPLTDEQIWEAYMKAPVDIDCHVSDLHKFARAIEAAHGIK